MTGTLVDLGAGRVRTLVIVDGSNACYGPRRGRPSLGRLLRIREELGKHNLNPMVIVDANLRHVIDEPAKLEELLASGEVMQVPAGRVADDFILQLALRRQAKGDSVYVLTNDLFPVRSAQGTTPRIAFMVVPLGNEEEVIFSPPLETIAEVQPEPPPEAAKPSLPGPLTPQVVARNSDQEPGEPEPMRPGIPSDLLGAFVKFFVSQDAPPKEGSMIAFTQVAGYLHEFFGGDFCKQFGYRKPKEFAKALEEHGYVKLRALGPLGLALYLEITSHLVEECGRPELEGNEPGGAESDVDEGRYSDAELLAEALRLLQGEKYFPTENRILAKFKIMDRERASQPRTHAILNRAVENKDLTKSKEGTLTCYWPSAGMWEAVNPDDLSDPYSEDLWKDFDRAIHQLPPYNRTLVPRYHLAKHLAEVGSQSLQDLSQADREHMVQLAISRKIVEVVQTLHGPRMNVPIAE